MTRQNCNQLLTNAKTAFLVMTMILGIFAVATLATDKRIDMQGSTVTITAGNTVNRNLYRIPARTAGRFMLKFKWHVLNPLPIYNRLTIRLKHGSRTISSLRCYSYHSRSRRRRPKCSINTRISQTEANRRGRWSIQINNNSGHQVVGFDVEKGSDINPLVPRFTSVFRYTASTTGGSACSSSTRRIDMQGSTLTIPMGNTITKTLSRIGRNKGVILLRAKWHALNIPILQPYNRLKVQLLKPNGQIARTKTAYGYNAGSKSPKMAIRYNVTSADAALPGRWKIRVQNNSNYEVLGFDIEKGSDNNPMVPNFRSTYKANCN